MNIIRLIVFIVGLWPSVVLAEGVRVPPAFEYDGLPYKHDAFLKGYSISFRADIDGKPGDETIVMFPASDDQNYPRAFTFIYGNGYEFRIPTYEYPKKIEAIDIDNDGRKEIFLYAHGGVRYTKLFVFKYEDEKGLRKLFENGSALGIGFEQGVSGPTIKVGRPAGPDEGWAFDHPEPRQEVYVWDGKAFSYQASASTAPKTSEPQEYQGLVGDYAVSVSDASFSEGVPRARLGDTLVYRQETVMADDRGSELVLIPEAGGRIRVHRERHQEFKVVRKEDFGEAFGFYLKPGLSWEEGKDGLTQKCSREAERPCYYVQKTEDVVTPAGTFRDCFKIVVDNIPDLDARWYYPGIGVVRFEYRRQGGLLILTKELEEIMRQ